MAAIPRACVYLRDEGDQDELRRWEQVAAEWCDANGYRLAQLILDRDGSRWVGVHQLIAAEAVDVVVVPRRNHMPQDTFPRIEVITDQPGRPQVVTSAEGARVVRRQRVSRLRTDGRPDDPRRPQIIG